MRRVFLLLVVVFVAFSVRAQERSISGTVIDDEGERVPGANVLIKGTNTGTVTDIDGQFRITVPSNDAVLVFSFIGMKSQEVAVGSRSVIDVTMARDVEQLSELVVTALGISREKRSLGYSVQEVAGDDVAKSREPNIVNALQGKVAGVQIQGTSGALGGSSRITIRGVNSFTGDNQPLFVVDGMPINNDNYASGSQQRGFGGGQAYDYGNAASDINPADIESISVLKGAAATALYGVRGSNGVILITTKSGKGKKGIGVSVNSAVTFDDPLTLIPHQTEYGGGAIQSTPSGFVEFTQDGVDYLAPLYSKDGAWGPKYDPNVMVRHWDSWDPGNSMYKETRPWVAPENSYEEFFETGVTLTNSVAVEGSNEQGSFRLGYTNLDQSGIMPNSDLARNTVSIAANYKLTEKLTASASANFVVQNASGRNITGYNNGNPMQAFTQWWQTQLDVERLKNYTRTDGTQQTWNADGVRTNPDGTLNEYLTSPTFFDNPYYVRNEFLQEDRRDRLFGYFQLAYKITDEITVIGKAMRDGFSFQAYEGVPVGSVDQSFYAETSRTFNEYNFDGRIMYNKTFSDISVTGTLGGNRMTQRRTRTRIETVGGLALPGFFNLANSVDNPAIDIDPSQPALQEQAINSIFGLLSLGYKGMLFLDASARRDWASTLPEKENPYDYFSVSGSFVFSELPALSSSNILSFGKLRAGWGQAANNPGPYSLNDTYQPLTPNFGSFPRYTVPDTRNNPNLQPEFTTEYEVGIEMRLLDNRIGLDISYYNRETSEQIMTVDASPTTGYNSKIVNAGTMANSGIEIQLNGTPLQLGDFSWDVNVNFATYNNKVVSLADGVDNIRMGSTWAADLLVAEDKPYMSIWGEDFIYDNGKIVVDENGFPLTTGEYVYLGTAIPDFTGGIGNTFSYKGLALGALIDFQKGGSIHSTSLQWANYSGMTPETVEVDGRKIREDGLIIDGVTEDGSPNTTPVDPQTYYQSYWNVAAPNLYKAGFLKLRELSLTYNVPSKLVASTPFKDVSVGVFGRNLAILHADLPYLDPQVVTGSGNIQGLENAQVPSTRSIGFNLGFKF